MNRKNIFLDEIYLYAIWPSLLGFVSQNFVTLILLLLIVASYNPLTIFLTELYMRGGAIVFFCGIFALLALIGFIFGFFARGNINLFLAPIRPIPNLGLIRKYSSDADRKEYAYFKYLLPLLTILLLISIFFISFISGYDWHTALQNAIFAILPFHLGFLTIHICLIGLETVVLIVRFIVTSNGP